MKMYLALTIFVGLVILTSGCVGEQGIYYCDDGSSVASPNECSQNITENITESSDTPPIEEAEKIELCDFSDWNPEFIHPLMGSWNITGNETEGDNETNESVEINESIDYNYTEIVYKFRSPNISVYLNISSGEGQEYWATPYSNHNINGVVSALEAWVEKTDNNINFYFVNDSSEADLVFGWKPFIGKTTEEFIIGTAQFTEVKTIGNVTDIDVRLAQKSNITVMIRPGSELSFVKLVALHELGHILGLGHYTNIYAVMLPIELNRAVGKLSKNETSTVSEIYSYTFSKECLELAEKIPLDDLEEESSD